MVLGAGAYTWATTVEPHWLEISNAKLSLEGLPTAWTGKRLVQVSDFHQKDSIAQLATFREMPNCEKSNAWLVQMT